MQALSLEGSAMKALGAVAVVLSAYMGVRHLRNAEKRKEEELERYKSEKTALPGLLNALNRDRNLQPARFVKACFGTACAAGVIYFSHNEKLEGVEQAVFDFIIAGIFGGEIAEFYIRDTSFIVSPKKQAQLETRLQQQEQ